jgi:hypothetical protein
VKHFVGAIQGLDFTQMAFSRGPQAAAFGDVSNDRQRIAPGNA